MMVQLAAFRDQAKAQEIASLLTENMQNMSARFDLRRNAN